MFPMHSGASNGGGRRGDLFCSRRGLHFDRGAGGGRRLPAGGQQGTEVALVGHALDPFEDVGEIDFGIVAVTTGTFHQGVNDSGALAGGLPAHEEPGLFPDGAWPDSVFDPGTGVRPWI